MKAYIITCIITMVVAIIGFTLYIRYDTQKFIESLPKVPSKEEISSRPRNDVLLQSRTEQGVPKQTGQDHAHHYATPDETLQTLDVPEAQNGTSPVRVHSDTRQTRQAAKKLTRKLHYDDMTTDQKIAKLRRWLVENHDNKAEIEKYLTLERMYIQSMVYLPNNLAVLDMHIDDQVRRAELLVKLYPNNGNEGFLRRTLEIKAKIEAGEYIPMYEFPREYWHEVSQ